MRPTSVDWKAQATSLEHIVVYDLADEPVVVDGRATQERIAMVSEGFWALSGVQLAHGRVPAAGERGTLLVSQAFFETHLGGDPKTIGKSITVDGRREGGWCRAPGIPSPARLAGVAGFEPRDVAAYKTVRVEAPSGNMLQMLNVIAKLKAGVSIEQARAEIELASVAPALKAARVDPAETLR